MGAPIRNGTKSGVSAGLMLAGAVSVLALPSGVLAFTTSFDSRAPQAVEAGRIESLDADGPGMRLARGMPLQPQASGQIYPFTPAKNPNRPDRSVTVAVRIDPNAIKGITVRGSSADDNDASRLHLAQTAFNLGMQRGYRSFAPGIVPAPTARKGETPDLTHYSIPQSATPGDSRFSPRIVIDEKQAAGRAPRTFAGDKEDQVDLGGSYRVTRNLNVTAGVRYSQDRERLLPLTDGKQDSQAVYVGTQFRF